MGRILRRNNMSEEIVKDRYTLIPDGKSLHFMLNTDDFVGLNIKIKLPIDYVDVETKDEVDLDIKYSKKKAKELKLTKDQIEEEAAQCFLDIFKSAANKKAVDYLVKMKEEGKEVKI